MSGRGRIGRAATVRGVRGSIVATLLVAACAAAGDGAPPTPARTATPVGAVARVSEPAPAPTGVAASASPAPARAAQRSTTAPALARPLWVDLALAALASFAGALGGAWIVFFLQTRKERRERREEQIRQLRRVQFALANRALTLKEFSTQWLEPARPFKGFWAALQSPAGMVPPEPLSLEQVAFVLDSDPNLLGKLHLAERKFQSFLVTVDRFAERRDEAARKLEARTQEADEPGGVFTEDEVRKMAGPRLHHELKTLAASLYEREPLADELMKLVDEVGDHVVSYGGKRLRVEVPGASSPRPAGQT